ncbi:unnamed protein product, partial [Ascophyllum nodosum]
QPKCLASISLAPCDRTQRHSSYPSFKGCKHGARLGTGWFAPLLFAPLPGAPG